MRLRLKVTILLSAATLCLSTLAHAEDKAEVKEEKESKPLTAEDITDKNVKIKYKKRTTVDFGAQNIEGKIRRPETSLIEASESITDQGVLRLRENFLDKIASFSGEDVK